MARSARAQANIDAITNPKRRQRSGQFSILPEFRQMAGFDPNAQLTGPGLVGRDGPVGGGQPFGQGGSLLGASTQGAVNAANVGNEARLAEIRGLAGEAISSTENVFGQQAQDARNRATRQQSTLSQSLASRGLGASSLATTQQSGIKRELDASLARIGAQQAMMTSQMKFREAGFLERVEETGPDLGRIGELERQMAAFGSRAGVDTTPQRLPSPQSNVPDRAGGRIRGGVQRPTRSNAPSLTGGRQRTRTEPDSRLTSKADIVYGGQTYHYNTDTYKYELATQPGVPSGPEGQKFPQAAPSRAFAENAIELSNLPQDRKRYLLSELEALGAEEFMGFYADLLSED